jgi:hypothetical protein
MVAMPSGYLGDPLATDWAQTALFFPEVEKPLFSFESCFHFYVET